MAKIKADGDTWSATYETSARDGRMVVFFCTSNGQRPYRVVLLDGDEVANPDGLDGLGAGDLRRLFERSESMNVSPS